MEYKKYLGAIFDCDGTLLESMEMWRGNATRIVNHFGFEAKTNLDEICIHLSMKDACEYINKEYNMQNTPVELTNLSYELVKEQYYNNLELKSKAKELLDELKALNYKMIVATATPVILVKECFKRLGVLDYFIDILSVRDYDTNKGESKIYDVALSKLGIEKKDCLVFEDAVHAIKTCINADYNVVIVKDATQSERLSEVADKVLECIDLE